MTSLHLWSRRLPASLSGAGQLADFLAEVSIASACKRPASHAPATTQPAPSTSALRCAGCRVVDDLPGGVRPVPGHRRGCVATRSPGHVRGGEKDHRVGPGDGRPAVYTASRLLVEIWSRRLTTSVGASSARVGCPRLSGDAAKVIPPARAARLVGVCVHAGACNRSRVAYRAGPAARILSPSPDATDGANLRHEAGGGGYWF
jgi:hypothetical protein